jgi:type II secretory pathway component PulL
MSGLADRERESCLVAGIRRDVLDAFVDEVAGEMTEIEEEVDALETLRLRVE